MGKKKRRAAQEAPSPSIRFWLPAVLFPTISLAVILLSLDTPHYFVDHAFEIYSIVKKLLSDICLITACAVLLTPKLRERLCQNIDGLSEASSIQKIIWPAIASLGVTLLIGFLKYCQYRGFQMDLMDTTAMTQMAFNTLHGRWLESTVFGCNVLAIHFAFTIALLAPILLFWKGALPLLILQCVAIGSMGLATYEIIWFLTSSSLAGFMGMLLCYASPLFHGLIQGPLENSIFMAAFFLWAILFMLQKRWGWCVLFIILSITGREQFPFTLAGLGLYWLIKDGFPRRENVLIGSGIFISAVTLWFVEMHIISSFPNGLTAGYWIMYSKFGSTRNEVVHFAMANPFSFIGNAIAPPFKLWNLIKPLLFVGLAPLVSPASLIPFVVAALPQQLVTLLPGQVPDWQISSYQNYLLQYSAPILGPLLFSTGLGLSKIYNDLGRFGKRREFLLIPVLAICGLGLRSAPINLKHNWGIDMFYSAPKVIRQVPSEASLWTEDLEGPWLACRAQLKVLPLKLGANAHIPNWFTSMLFRPEYVLLSKGRLRSGGVPDLVIQFLMENHYIKIIDRVPKNVILNDPQNLFVPAEQRWDLILLKDPSNPHEGQRSPPLVLPSAVDEKSARDYYQYLMSS